MQPPFEMVVETTAVSNGHWMSFSFQFFFIFCFLFDIQYAKSSSVKLFLIDNRPFVIYFSSFNLKFKNNRCQIRKINTNMRYIQSMYIILRSAQNIQLNLPPVRRWWESSPSTCPHSEGLTCPHVVLVVGDGSGGTMGQCRAASSGGDVANDYCSVWPTDDSWGVMQGLARSFHLKICG